MSGFYANKYKNMKKTKIIKLLKISNQPLVSYLRDFIHFGDINRGEHIVPLNSISLSCQFVKEAANLEEEPEYRYFIYYGTKEIEVTGCLWIEIQDLLMSRTIKSPRV